MTKTRVLKKIDRFLKEKRASVGGGWAAITPEDMELLDDVIAALVELKCMADADGDRPIEWRLVNRRVHERFHYVPMPYQGRTGTDEDCLSVAVLNVRIAADLLDRVLRLRVSAPKGKP